MKLLLASVCFPLALAGAAAPDSGRGNFSVDSTLVLVNVAVTDPQGRFVTGLERQDFQIFEEKSSETIAYFSAEDSPVSVCLVLDFSSSMAPRFGELQRAVAEFLKSANPVDEFCLIEFRDRPELSIGFTQSPGEIQNRVAMTRPAGTTALLDAIHLGLRQMRKARNVRKILLIVSDGGDNNSRFSRREVENLAREADVQVYAIGIQGHSASAAEAAMWEGAPLLDELALEGGGRYFQIDDSRELPGVTEKIGRELRHQYVLGYVPRNLKRDGRYRHIRVKIARSPGQPRLSSYWRRGYFAVE